MKSNYLTLLVIAVILIILIPTQSFASLNKDERCYYCIGGVYSFKQQAKECNLLDGNYFHRGTSVEGAECFGGQCHYTVRIICSIEAKMYTLPPDILFIDEYIYKDTIIECSECSGNH